MTSWVTPTVTLAFLLISFAFVQMQTSNTWETISYFVGIIFSSILPFYINSGALEVQFGILLGIFAVSAYRALDKTQEKRYYIFLLLSAALLPLYKDVAVFLMAITCMVAAVARTPVPSLKNTIRTLRNSNSILVPVVGLTASAIFISIGYNWLRYKSILPVEYLTEAKGTRQPFTIHLANFFWTFFSPNGGLIVGWTASFSGLLLVLFLSDRRPSGFGISFSICVNLIYSMILATWWSPFGWAGWGDRLLIPTLIASLIVLSSTSIKVETRGSAGEISGGRTVKVALFGIAVVFSLISLAYTWLAFSANRYDYLNKSMLGSDVCKAAVQLQDRRAALEFKRSDLYARCHLDRFEYIAGLDASLAPLQFLRPGKYPVKIGNAVGILGKGWSGIEEWGVWSDSTHATIRFVTDQRPRRVSLELDPFIAGTVKQQRVILKFEGRTLFSGALKERSILSVAIPLMTEPPHDELFRIDLELPDAVSPLSVGLNSDTRLLAIGLRSIELE